MKQRILDAALDLVETHGVKALTQPRLATRAGVRQSHLTYYFPRKEDLYVGLLQASHARVSHAASDKPAESFEEMMASLKALIFDQQRMRFFLSMAIEAGEKSDLQKVLALHARDMAEKVAPYFGRKPQDAAVLAFIDALRGVGLRMLIAPDAGFRRRFDPAALARDLGLTPCDSGVPAAGAKPRARQKTPAPPRARKPS